LLTQRAGQGLQPLCALAERLAAPGAESGGRAVEGGVQLALVFIRVTADRFAGGGVDREGVGLVSDSVHGTVLLKVWIGISVRGYIFSGK